MEQQQSTLKKLPYSVTKSQLVAMYKDNIALHRIRTGINDIIRKNRKLDPDNTVQYKFVEHTELMLFIEEYGLPEGFEL